METNTTVRPIHEIAREISRDWTTPHFAAIPYIRAMRALEGVDDAYGNDSAKSILLYFIVNASTWRGETARRVKAEIKAMVKNG